MRKTLVLTETAVRDLCDMADGGVAGQLPSCPRSPVARCPIRFWVST